MSIFDMLHMLVLQLKALHVLRILTLNITKISIYLSIHSSVYLCVVYEVAMGYTWYSTC